MEAQERLVKPFKGCWCSQGVLTAQGKGGAAGGSSVPQRLEGFAQRAFGIVGLIPVTAEVWIRKEKARAGHEVPQGPHSLLHDHVAQGVAQGVILIVQHERDTVPIRPIRLDLSPVGREAVTSLRSGTHKG